jgi:hypothetical protein
MLARSSVRVARLAVLAALVAIGPPPSSAADASAPLSTDRAAPTPLTSQQIAGRLGESPATTYYVSFLAGPGEARLTLDAKGPGTGRALRLGVFDRSARELGSVSIVATSREARRVLRLDVPGKQPVVLQIAIDAGGPGTDVTYRIQLAGAVEPLRPDTAAGASPPPPAPALSTNRDAPTPLSSPRVAGRLGESAATTYYVDFLAGPGELRLTLDVRGPVTGRTLRIALFDREARELGNVSVVATPREERRVLRLDVPAKQPVVAQIAIDAGGPGTDVTYRVQLAGAVETLSRGTTTSLSRNRDAPTPLTSPTVSGRLGAAPATSYYVGFQAGPGEVQVTLEAKGPGSGRTVRVGVFDQDARELGNAWVVATARSERRVLRVNVPARQSLVAQIAIDAGGPRTDVAYRIQVTGAVDLAAPPAVAGAPAAGSPSVSRGEFTFKVTYRVTGSAERVDLTYRDSQGATQQATAPLPWQLAFDARGGSFLYVSAQIKQAGGSVTCEILVDGETRANSTSSGAYVIAECSNAAERR